MIIHSLGRRHGGEQGGDTAGARGIFVQQRPHHRVLPHQGRGAPRQAALRAGEAAAGGRAARQHEPDGAAGGP